MERFKINDLGSLAWFLGMKATRDRPSRRIWINLEAYIEKIAVRYGLKNSRGAPGTPMSSSEPLEPYNGLATTAEIHAFQSFIGSILYPTVLFRLDVAHHATRLARHQRNPSPGHKAAAPRVIQHLYAIKTLSHLFDGNYQKKKKQIEVYSDASFADDQVDRKSSQGYLIYLFGIPIAWQAFKQTAVATSSTEAELLALTTVVKETLALIRLFSGLRLHVTDEVVVWCDNKQTIRLVSAEIPRLQTALKHVDVYNAWIRQKVLRGTTRVEYLQTTRSRRSIDKLLSSWPVASYCGLQTRLNTHDFELLHYAIRQGCPEFLY